MFQFKKIDYKEDYFLTGNTRDYFLTISQMTL